MISINPFSEISAFIPSLVMQTYVVVMFLLVIGATLFDVVHKKSAKYFFNNSVKAKKSATREVSSGEKVSIAFKTFYLFLLSQNLNLIAKGSHQAKTEMPPPHQKI